MPEVLAWRPHAQPVPLLPFGADHFALNYRGMPLGGLGLPLAEAGRNGIPDEAYAAALGQIMIPPAVDLGVDQSRPLSGGETCDPGYLLGWFRHGMLSDAPSPGHSALSGLTSVWQIAPVLAFVDLPATDTLQTCAAGFRKVLHRLAQGDAALDALPKWERWPHRLRRPLTWTFPRGRGPVTQADVTRFAAGFPRFARWVSLVLGPRLAEPNGVAAAIANAVATSALGIPIDMRVGSLVSPSAVSDAICLAAGSDDYAPGDRRAERLARFVECQVPRAGIRGPGKWWSDGLFGAAWSCDVDAALNRPAACLGTRPAVSSCSRRMRDRARPSPSSRWFGTRAPGRTPVTRRAAGSRRW